MIVWEEPAVLNTSVSRRQLRWASFSIVMFIVAAVTFGAAWPSAAYDTDPQANDVIAYTSPQPHPSGGSPTPDVRIEVARNVLAARLVVQARRLLFVSSKEVRRSDTSLGCPEPGRMYGKVIVPGYRITFSYEGNHYEVHTASKTGVGYALSPVSCEGGLSY